LVTPLEMENDHVVFDIDTLADYQQVVQRLESGEVVAGETRAAAGHWR
jgi:hypothetical protein